MKVKLPTIIKLGISIIPSHMLHGVIVGQGGHGSQSVSLIKQGLHSSHVGVVEKQKNFAVMNDIIRVIIIAIKNETISFFLFGLKFIIKL